MFGYKLRGHAPVNRRRDRRFPVSLPAKVNDETVLLKDISLGGLGFFSEETEFEVGDDVLVEIEFSPTHTVKIGASIVRTDGKQEYGASFLGLSSNAFQLIEDLELGQFRRKAVTA